MIRRPYGPGMHGKRRRRAPSEFGEQLKEKQKIRFSYALKEGQLGRIFAEAAKKTEATGDALMRLLKAGLTTSFSASVSPARGWSPDSS